MQYQSFVMMERGWKTTGGVEISPHCPRCGSSNTKFCYYNNYSLTQPRYFCKGCRRYWTKGGSLRNVPVGGGCRKNRRGKSIRLSTSIMSGLRGPTDHHVGPSHGSSSSTTPPSIDLALVYANFLNPPDSNPSTGLEPQEPTSSGSGLSLDPSISSPSGMINGPESNIGLLEAGPGFFGWESLSNLFADTHLNVKDPIFDHPLQAATDPNYYALSGVLPHEDVVSRDTTEPWAVTHHLMVNEHGLQGSEPPLIGLDHRTQAEEPDLLTGASYRVFDDFPGEDTLPRK